jgi:hypothetical protein
MSKRLVASCALMAALCLSAPIAFGAVPKLLILEHFTDYFG